MLPALPLYFLWDLLLSYVPIYRLAHAGLCLLTCMERIVHDFFKANT